MSWGQPGGWVVSVGGVGVGSVGVQMVVWSWVAWAWTAGVGVGRESVGGMGVKVRKDKYTNSYDGLKSSEKLVLYTHHRHTYTPTHTHRYRSKSVDRSLVLGTLVVRSALTVT